ncbi:hypothetical protein MMC19_000672 [Ptychographa xylographoides]|nr:hypothetical protein [Ptychographa xylographoides]
MDSMKDLVPAPLRKSRSPAPRPRPGEEMTRSQPIAILGARSGWENYPPRRTDALGQARSVSPEPSSRPRPAVRARSPRQRYLHIPPEYLNAQQARNFPGSTNQRPQVSAFPSSSSLPVSTNDRPRLPIAASMSTTNLPRAPPRAPSDMRHQIRLNPAAPGAQSGSRKPRKYVPSMVDYLSLEQLEDLWESQDQYVGPINVPQKPATPRWRIDENDPRSPLRPGDLDIHPAFRNYSIHNSFARAVI